MRDRFQPTSTLPSKSDLKTYSMWFESGTCQVCIVATTRGTRRMVPPLELMALLITSSTVMSPSVLGTVTRLTDPRATCSWPRVIPSPLWILPFSRPTAKRAWMFVASNFRIWLSKKVPGKAPTLMAPTVTTTSVCRAKGVLDSDRLSFDDALCAGAGRLGGVVLSRRRCFSMSLSDWSKAACFSWTKRSKAW